MFHILVSHYYKLNMLMFIINFTGKHFKQKGMVLPFQPLAMTFSNVNYYVDVPMVGI